jgi:hypothetical protein
VVVVLASGGASFVEGGVVVWELLCRGLEKWGAFVELLLQCWETLLKGVLVQGFLKKKLRAP